VLEPELKDQGKGQMSIIVSSEPKDVSKLCHDCIREQGVQVEMKPTGQLVGAMMGYFCQSGHNAAFSPGSSRPLPEGSVICESCPRAEANSRKVEGWFVDAAPVAGGVWWVRNERFHYRCLDCMERISRTRPAGVWSKIADWFPELSLSAFSSMTNLGTAQITDGNESRDVTRYEDGASGLFLELDTRAGEYRDIHRAPGRSSLKPGPWRTLAG